MSHLERICHEIVRVDGLNLRPIRLVYLLKGAQFQRLFSRMGYYGKKNCFYDFMKVLLRPPNLTALLDNGLIAMQNSNFRMNFWSTHR